MTGEKILNMSRCGATDGLMKGGQDERRASEDGVMDDGGQREETREWEHVEIKARGIKHNQVAAMKGGN